MSVLGLQVSPLIRRAPDFGRKVLGHVESAQAPHRWSAPPVSTPRFQRGLFCGMPRSAGAVGSCSGAVVDGSCSGKARSRSANASGSKPSTPAAASLQEPVEAGVMVGRLADHQVIGLAVHLPASSEIRFPAIAASEAGKLGELHLVGRFSPDLRFLTLVHCTLASLGFRAAIDVPGVFRRSFVAGSLSLASSRHVLPYRARACFRLCCRPAGSNRGPARPGQLCPGRTRNLVESFGVLVHREGV